MLTAKLCAGLSFNWSSESRRACPDFDKVERQSTLQVITFCPGGTMMEVCRKIKLTSSRGRLELPRRSDPSRTDNSQH